MAANDTAASKPFQPTKPEEFHFATDSRLRGPWAAEEVAPVPVPVQPHSGPTRPKEFHFATEARAKVKEPAQGEEQEYVDFTRSLRSSSTSHKDAAVTRTVPQPFNLTESRRRNTEEPSKFVSVAEQNLMFHTKTPQRFRTKRAGDDIQEDAKRTKPNSLGITIPQTPQLFTTKRSRPVTYLTMEQIEEQEFEEAQKWKGANFQGQTSEQEGLSAPPAALTVKKLPTVPEPFNITDTKKSVTKAEEEYGPADESSASIASSSHGGKKVATKQRPFSFDSRDKAKLHQKEEKIKKVIQEEKSLAEFHAQPMPSFVNGVLGLPPKKPPTPTKLQPFNLQADQRGAVKQERFKAQLEEESQEDAEQRKFRARPGSVVHKAPFIPEKSQHPLTEISGFALNTEVRAGKRSEYDLQQKMHEEEITAAKKLEEERQAAEEAAEVAQQRQEAVHKANPMPKFKPVSFQLPQLPVTIPKSPKFATESRLRSKSRANSTMNISSATYTAE
ncbi:Targeting protein for Xklp2 [Chionoecetes opilio]|uniref:Targeting protein for Xklp2 n=1 Tax=Chionoecetes opilio TaxID=41210 RepID=A0A8J5CS06_CHIOP|nr:Targeting protein for Xklp2 [Chionoecetes opilio]